MYIQQHARLFVSLILLFCLVATGVTAQESEPFHESPLNLTTAPVNPEFLEYIAQKGERVHLQSTGDHFVPGVVPSPIDFSHTKGMQIRSTNGEYQFLSTYPSSFDLRDEGKVSPIKDQGDEGNCWAFGTYASLESFFLPSEVWDFSENNIKNILNADFDYGEGGNHWMSTAYLARWSGPVLEVDDPYEAGSTSSPDDLPPVKRVQDVLFLPERGNKLDNDNVRLVLTEYGVVQVSMFWEDSGWNPDTNAFYQNQKTSPNHAVAIVGWDDAYPRSNFNTNPPGDGAFIIKNSWGTGFGDEGFFYLSYYDTSIRDFVVFTGENTETYDRVYQYDPMGWVTSLGYNDSDTAWFSNIFTAESEETITAVGFYTPVVDSSYRVDVYTNPDDGPRRQGGVVSTATGTIPSPGYHTIEIPPASLQAGEPFSVIVRLETPGYNRPIPIEYALPGYSSKATANPGEGYVSHDGSEWHDITEVSIQGLDMTTASVCLKAYTTVSTLPAPVFSANITSGNAPLTVLFTDASAGTPTAWYWDFGDGGESRVRNPVHTFTETGDYTVQLTVTNSFGQGMMWREITVSPAPTPAPVAAFTASPTTGPAPLMVQFTDESTNDPTSWRWEYSTGDGWTEFSTSQHPSKTFTSEGTYSVRLTVENDEGSDTDAKMDYIRVGSSPTVESYGVFRSGTWYIKDDADPRGFTATEFGVGTDTPVVVDGEIGVFRGGTWYIRDETDPRGFTATEFGVGTDTPVVVDGKIGVFRGGTWYIRDETDPRGFTVEVFGVGTDTPVVVDGGIGVFRGGTWYIRDEADPRGFTSTEFGVGTDTPVVFDGEIGVFRGGTWYIRDGADPRGFRDFIFGTAGDVPVVVTN